MNIANLIGVHEARVAHHVATIGKIDGEYGASAKLYVGSAVTVDGSVFGSAKITSEEQRFDPFEKCRIGGHHVIKLSVLWTALAHDHLPIFFKYLSLDLPRMLVHQSIQRYIPGDNGV